MPVPHPDWLRHEALLRKYAEDATGFRNTPSLWKPFLRIKYELSLRALKSCRLCAWDCGVDRLKREKGFCGVGSQSASFAEKLSYSEELALLPSYRVEFSGCNMRCGYCNVGEAVIHPMAGTVVNEKELAGRMEQAWRAGARSLYFLGGEPVVHLTAMIRTLWYLPAQAPVVIHTNGYETSKGLALMDGLAQTMIVDLKFGNDVCAKRLSATPNYWATVTANLSRWSGCQTLIVRHVTLPGHVACCTEPALKWVAEHLPKAQVSFVSQFIPVFPIKRLAELDRLVSVEEQEQVEKMVSDRTMLVAA